MTHAKRDILQTRKCLQTPAFYSYTIWVGRGRSPGAPPVRGRMHRPSRPCRAQSRWTMDERDGCGETAAVGGTWITGWDGGNTVEQWEIRKTKRKVCKFQAAPRRKSFIMKWCWLIWFLKQRRSMCRCAVFQNKSWQKDCENNSLTAFFAITLDVFGAL